MYGIANNNVIIKYPVFPIQENPNISFIEDWQGGVIDGVCYVNVEMTLPPEQKKGYFVEKSTPIYDKKTNKYKETWVYKRISNEQYFGTLKDSIMHDRREKESSGIRIGDYVFQTDPYSQLKYTVLGIKNKSVLWKTQDNKFVQINPQEIEDKVMEYVQACLEVEKKYNVIIDNGDLDVIDNTDFTLGWPNNGIA